LYLCARFGREAMRRWWFVENFGFGVEKKDTKKFGFGD
jgi:hypothetical protein